MFVFSECFPLLNLQTLVTAASDDCSLMDRDLMQVIYTLAKAGHQQHIPELTERLRQERGFVPGTHAQTHLITLHITVVFSS